MSSDEAAKLERARHALNRSETFQRFVEDPDIGAFLDAYERDCITRMVKAAPIDDETRRNEALKIAAMRDLRSFLNDAIRAGERAAETLMKASR